jgi:hypothetical protein
VRTIQCKARLELPDLQGARIDESHYDVLAGGDEAVDILKPDGSPLVKYRPRWFDAELVKSVLPTCRRAATLNDNRGTAAGDIALTPVRNPNVVGEVSDRGNHYREVKQDGTLSKTMRGGLVYSGIIGYFDRSVRFPFCRQTAFLIHQAAKWQKFLPYIKRADAGFHEFMPDRWSIQREWADKTAQDWVIPESTFTTVTVNRNFQTAVHKDAGDLHDGFGVMSCLRNDKYQGGFLCFPEYRVAVDMQNGCLCLADVHEWHGNTPLRNLRIGYERITLVFYYREHMIECKSAKEEEQVVKRRKPGDPIRSR